MAGTTLTELRDRRDEIIEIARARGASRVRVFGSVARDLGGLQMDLQDLLQRDVDVVTERRLRTRVAERVLADAVEL